MAMKMKTFVAPPPLVPPRRLGYGGDVVKAEIKVRKGEQHVKSYTGYARTFDIITTVQQVCRMEKQKRDSLDPITVEMLPYPVQSCIEIRNIATNKVRVIPL